VTVDLWCLVVNAIWGWALVMIESTGKTRAGGTRWNLGNRDVDPAVPDWVKRAGRAVANHKENFPLFLTAVVVVHLAGKADRVSAMAAVAYVIARAAHAVLYIGGVKGLRSAAYLAGLLATLVVFTRLLA
jgi:uncharacterized MAPEG superfamily protein